MAELRECPWCKRYLTRHMDAYYYGFEPTGIAAIDNILCSVASAGKAYHHTESWGDPIDDSGESHVGRIQRAANVAAEEIRRPAPSGVDVPSDGTRDRLTRLFDKLERQLDVDDDDAWALDRTDIEWIRTALSAAAKAQP